MENRKTLKQVYLDSLRESKRKRKADNDWNSLKHDPTYTDDSFILLMRIGNRQINHMRRLLAYIEKQKRA